MSAVAAALATHQRASADRDRAKAAMGSGWRDAAARIVDARFLDPLTLQDRDFAAALTDLADQLDRAERLVQE